MEKSSRHTLDSIQEAEDYLNSHRINELLNDLCASVCFKKPDDVSCSGLSWKDISPAKTVVSLTLETTIEVMQEVCPLLILHNESSGAPVPYR